MTNEQVDEGSVCNPGRVGLKDDARMNEDSDLQGFLDWIQEDAPPGRDAWGNLRKRLEYFFRQREARDPQELADATLSKAALHYRRRHRDEYPTALHYVLGFARNENRRAWRVAGREGDLDDAMPSRGRSAFDEAATAEMIELLNRKFGKERIAELLTYSESSRLRGEITASNKVRVRMHRLMKKVVTFVRSQWVEIRHDTEHSQGGRRFAAAIPARPSQGHRPAIVLRKSCSARMPSWSTWSLCARR